MNRSTLVFLLSILLMRGNAIKQREWGVETVGRLNSKTIDESFPETVPLIPCTFGFIPRWEGGGHIVVRADV